MSVLQVNEITNYDGASVSVDTTAFNVTANTTVTGGLSVTGSSVFATVDINGGSIDGVTVGTNAAVTDLRVDNLQIDGNSITSTNTDGDISVTPNGTGNVNLGVFEFDADQTVGASQNNFVMSYDNSTALISLKSLDSIGGITRAEAISLAIAL